MNPLVRALLGPWEWRPEVLVTLLPLTIVYVLGWLRLRRRRGSSSRLASGWRLAAYLAGMGSLALALLSPIDRLGGQLFFMHMIQHKITVMIAAPLIWLGNPFVVGLWGLPRTARLSVAGFFAEGSPARPLLEMVTHPFVVWLSFIVVYIGWHDPAAYDAALRTSWVHDIQHLSFFIVAMFYWHAVIGSAPRLHRYSAWGAIAMLVGAIPFNAITGFVIANAENVLYPYYETIPRIWGFSLLSDQSAAGVIMWVPGSEMFFQAAAVVLGWMFMMDKRRNRLPVVAGATDVADDAFIAPGLEHRALQNKWRELADARVQSRNGASS